MTTLQLEVQLSPTDLVRAMDEFSVPELQQFIAQLLVILAQKQVSTPSAVVTEVLPWVADQERRLQELRGMISAGAAELEAGQGVDGEVVFEALQTRIARIAAEQHQV